MLNGAYCGQFTARNASFSNTVYAFVGIDHHKQEVPAPTPYGVGFNVCNPQVNAPPSC